MANLRSLGAQAVYCRDKKPDFHAGWVFTISGFMPDQGMVRSTNRQKERAIS